MINNKVFTFFFLVVGLILYYFSVLDINIEETKFLNYNPKPDAIEYLAMTENFKKHGTFKIQIGSEYLPSRYPPGYPFFVYVFSRIFKQPLYKMPFITNNILGLLIVLVAFSYYYLQKRYLASGIIVLLLVTNPSLIIYSRSNMSEISGLFNILIVLYFLSRAVRKGIWIYFYIGFFLLGISTLIRTQFILWIPLIIVTFLVVYNYTHNKNESIQVFWISITFYLTGLIPCLIYNYLLYGNIFETGYDYWIHNNSLALNFSIKSVPENLFNILFHQISSDNNFTSANLFGTGAYFTLLFLILSVISIINYLKSDNADKLLLIAFIIIFLLTAFYNFINLRFFVYFIVLSCFIITYFLEFSFNRESRIYKSLIFIILFFVIIGVPSISGWPPRYTFSQTFDLVSKKYTGTKSSVYETVMKFNKKDYRNHNKVLVISPYNPVYLNAMLSDKFYAIPSDEKHDYRHSNKFVFKNQDIKKYIDSALTSNHEIVYLKYPGKHDESLKHIEELYADLTFITIYPTE